MNRKSTDSSANLPTLTYLHKVLHHYLRANTLNQKNCLGISGFMVSTYLRTCPRVMQELSMYFCHQMQQATRQWSA
jgi:hypothetical protein